MLPPAPPAHCQRFPELDPLVVQLLFNRGRNTEADVAAFLDPDFTRDTHDPYAFRAMERVIARLERALDTGEKIKIFGDYDVDGVCSTALLWHTFRALGTTVDVYIPDRYTEGYGLNRAAVDAFAKDGVTLLITCDCGTSNVDEIAAAQAQGMDVLVFDHHQRAPRVPAAHAMLNPCFAEETYPCKKLCSTGVVFKVATALLRKRAYGKATRRAPLPDGWEKWLLDLVALATVADLMPLLDENRVFVRYGLTVLRKTRRVGLRALCSVMGTPPEKITAATIGFQIAPRLNAAGRIKHANTAFTLLTTDDPAAALRLAQELDATNAERQQMTTRLFAEAQAQVPQELPIVLAATGEGWPSGVVGLVAGRLKEAYHRPAIAIGKSGDKLVGSGRSVAGFDITSALVEAKEYLRHFGGHPMACGFTLRSAEDLDAFIACLRTAASRALADRDLTPAITLDADLTLAQADWPLAEMVERFEPFGMQAPRPTFAVRNMVLREKTVIGKDQTHVRVLLADGTTVRKGIAFGMANDFADLHPGDRIDCAAHLGMNEWNGNRELQLQLIDVHPAP